MHSPHGVPVRVPEEQKWRAERNQEERTADTALINSDWITPVTQDMSGYGQSTVKRHNPMDHACVQRIKEVDLSQLENRTGMSARRVKS
jgi:hypothetical protein